jgi:TRAP-type C4-dicarboxylate transport system substrate-binding protein
MKRRDLLCVAAAAAAFALPPFATAQQKMVLKASDVHPLGYPTVEAIERMGKKLSAQTNGRLSIQMYPSMQLGGEKEMTSRAQIGAAIAHISVGAMGRWWTSSACSICRSSSATKRMRKVIDGPIGAELLEDQHQSEAGHRARLDGCRNPQCHSNKPVTNRPTSRA